MSEDTQNAVEKPAAGWRFRLGLVIFVVGFARPLLIPLVTASGLGTKWKAIISGALAVGIPEVFSIIAVAIMGKDGFDYLKQLFFGFLKKARPAGEGEPVALSYRTDDVFPFLNCEPYSS